MGRKLGLLAHGALTLAFAMVAQADIQSVHCPRGCPSSPSGNTLVFGHVYALSNNPETKFADWVAYEIDVRNFGPSPGRNWAPDPLLPASTTLEEDDYTGAHASDLQADRGHQAPLASFAGSRYWEELNYLSNITPQDKDLNQGPWKALEEAIRHAVGFRDNLWVFTGPLYRDGDRHLPQADEAHTVPDAYFKIVYQPDGQAVGFIMGQDSARGDAFCTKRVPLRAVAEASGLSFPALQSSAALSARLGCSAPPG